MLIEPAGISKNALYGWMTRLITPRPIAWVSTRSLEGVDNLAPYSYFNAVGTHPPTLMFCPANRPDGSKKDSLVNIESSGQFVVNLVTADLAAPMNQTSADYRPSESEFDATGLTRVEGVKVRAARVAEAWAAFECSLHTVMILGTGPGGANLVVGRIEAIHVDDRCLGPDGQFDAERFDTIGRMGGPSYAHTRDRFELQRPQL